jgi:hypothetical protein
MFFALQNQQLKERSNVVVEAPKIVKGSPFQNAALPSADLQVDSLAHWNQRK